MEGGCRGYRGAMGCLAAVEGGVGGAGGSGWGRRVEMVGAKEDRKGLTLGLGLLGLGFRECREAMGVGETSDGEERDGWVGTAGQGKEGWLAGNGGRWAAGLTVSTRGDRKEEVVKA